MTSLNYNSLLVKAQTAFDRNDLMSCELACHDLLKVNPRDARVHFLMYRVANIQQRTPDAIRHLEKTVELEPKHLPFRMSLGSLYARLGQYDKSARVLERAMRLDPTNPHTIAALAETHDLMGETDKARDLLEPVMRDGRDDAIIAEIWARVLINKKQHDAAIDALVRHAGSGALSDRFFFLLGEAYEKTGDFEKSFQSYIHANASSKYGFSLEQHIESHRLLIETFSPELLKRLPRPSPSSDIPMFIAGRPRSGTTLIEKILDAHPDVAGVGEMPTLNRITQEMNLLIGSSLTYPACVRDLDQNDVNNLSTIYLDEIKRRAPKAKRTVDKHLQNYLYLPLVSMLFPKARVLHIRRNPLDNCWACFVATINFGWTVDLRSLGITYRIYERLMEHWRQTLDLAILDIDYEAVVDDQEGWTRRILDFCGLPFDERCLRFHEAAKDGRKDLTSAPTLSYNQVRQPIYKTSVNRAAKFDKFLGPLKDALEEGIAIAEQIIPRKTAPSVS